MKRRAFIRGVVSAGCLGLLSPFRRASAGTAGEGPGAAGLLTRQDMEVLVKAYKGRFRFCEHLAEGIDLLTDFREYTAKEYYTVGILVRSEAGFRRGDGVRVILPILLQYDPWSLPQAAMPCEDGYTTIHLNGADVTSRSLPRIESSDRLDLGRFFLYRFEEDVRGPSVLLLVYGDRAKGFLGARCQEVSLEPGTSGYKPLEISLLRGGEAVAAGSYRFRVNPAEASRMVPWVTLRRRSGAASLDVRASYVDYGGNPAGRHAASVPLAEIGKGSGRSSARRGEDPLEVMRRPPCTEGGMERVVVTARGNALGGLSNPFSPQERPFHGYDVYFGDLHVHCGDISASDAKGSVDDIFLYARDFASLDFLAITDHAEFYGQRKGPFHACFAKSEEYNEKGRFVTFPGFEWTRNSSYGHRCVIFRDRATPTPIASFRTGADQLWADTPDALWALLEGYEALATPHYPMYTLAQAERYFPFYMNYYKSRGIGADSHQADWRFKSTRFQRLIEITSSWSKYYKRFSDWPPWQLTEDIERRPNGVQDALRAGHLLGFIGCTDNHSGRPGDGGVTGVLAAEKSRNSIWEALRARRTFASTKAGMIVILTVNGRLMGQEILLAGTVTVTLRAHGMAPLQRVELIRMVDGEFSTVFRQFPKQYDFHAEYRDSPETGKETAYYARITQEDGEQAWSSPVYCHPA